MKEPYTWKQFLWSSVPGLALALHFTSWVVGARMTLVANASLLVNLTPVVLPFFLWLFYREVVTRWEVLGTIFAVSGAVILSGANFRSGEDSFVGKLICIGSMLALAAYTALGRRNMARFKSLWLYIVPLYTVAGLVSLAAGLTVINPIKTYTLDNILYIIGLAVIPTVIGHSLLNQSLKYFRGQVVGVTILGQVIIASTMAFFFFGEVPTQVFYLAAGFVVVGITIVVATSSNGKKNS
jgi:drug/metabolite transporter (DMT)-like permease